MHTLAILHRIYAERIMWGLIDDDFDELKDRIKESWNHVKTGVSILKFLSTETHKTFNLAVKDSKLLINLFSDYNKYLLSVFDLQFHLTQVEYPFERKMAYELASKMMGHSVQLLESNVKPGIERLQHYLPKEKEPRLFYNYANILYNLCIAIKWLARGLNHAKEEEKQEWYSAINQAKKTAQNWYDYLEDVTVSHKPYYYPYVERWLDYIAKTYEHYKEIAEKVDYANMDSAYSGPIFEAESVMEKKEKVAPYKLEGYDNF